MEDMNLKNKVKSLPQAPGVYIMKDFKGKIIYIGKARALKNRVSQYFTGTKDDLKVRIMVENIHDFDFIVTDTELEALVLECNLIKAHRPKYNVLLKDDKNYPFIKVTINDEYPKIMLSRSIKKDGARYFGPYSSSKTVYDTIWLIRKTFMISNCKLSFPKQIKTSRPCLNYHINRCIAPCSGQISSQKYKAIFKDIISFLEGDYNKVLKSLKNEMELASENLEFEKAKAYKDRLFYIKKLSEKQKVVLKDFRDCDALGFVHGEGLIVFSLLFIRNGKLIDKLTIEYENIAQTDEIDAFASFVKQYYNENSYFPKEILLSNEIEDRELLEKYISDMAQKRVYIKVPKRGKSLGLVKMSVNNAKQVLKNHISDINKGKDVLLELKNALDLPGLPVRIEAYDVANIQDNAIVGAMVVYEQFRFKKSEYRKFKMKYNLTQDDYQSMKEMIYRRFLKAQEEEYENPGGSFKKFSKLPDLILLDGGRGHVNAVLNMLSNLDIKIAVFGMAKDKNHRVSKIVSKDKELILNPDMGFSSLIGEISKEVHRYTTEYHKKVRKIKTFESRLDNIKGIGEIKKQALIEYFKSVDEIKNAPLDQLTKVKGINFMLAQNIKEKLSKE